MNKKTWIIIAVVGVVILAGGYLVWAKYYSAPTYNAPTYQQPSQSTTNTNSSVQNTPSTTTVTPPVNVPTPTPTPIPKPNPAPAPSSAKTYTINIANFAFSPASITINAGDTIIWTNHDSVPHQIAGNGFGSNPISNGQSYGFKFNSAGTYNYHCAIHPSMTGVIIVK